MTTTADFNANGRRVPLEPVAFLLVAIVVSLATAEPALTLAGIVSFVVLIKLLWRPGEPPVLLFTAAFQWLSIVMTVLRADFAAVPADELYRNGGISYATWLSFAGVCVLALGMRLGAGRTSRLLGAQIFEHASRLSESRLFFVYFLALAFGLLLAPVQWLLPSARQILIPFINIRWIFVFLLLWVVLSKGRSYRYALGVIFVELMMGIGFFSNFRQIFFVLLIAWATVRPQINFRMAAVVAAIIIPLFGLGLVWTAIKSDFRVFLNKGTGQQVILVSYGEALSELDFLVGNLRLENVNEALDRMTDRIAYTDYFGQVTENVPLLIPYTGGAIWAAAVEHILTPRVFFPNKAEFDSDSEETMRYTGLKLASKEEGTWIALGYMAECYIDFGPIGMFAPIFLVGLMCGAMFRYLSNSSTGVLFGYSAAAYAILTSAVDYGISVINLTGGLIMIFLTMLVWLRLVPIFRPFLERTSGSKQVISYPLAGRATDV